MDKVPLTGYLAFYYDERDGYPQIGLLLVNTADVADQTFLFEETIPAAMDILGYSIISGLVGHIGIIPPILNN